MVPDAHRADGLRVGVPLDDVGTVAGDGFHLPIVGRDLLQAEQVLVAEPILTADVFDSLYYD